MEDARTWIGESKPLQAQNRVSHYWTKQYTPPLYFCACGGGRSSSPNTQLSLLSRLAGLGSFVGVRFTRIRSFRSPTLARAANLRNSSDALLWRALTSSTGRTLGASPFFAPLFAVFEPSMARKAYEIWKRLTIYKYATILWRISLKAI